MTFTEAAILLLRAEGKALTWRRLGELAVQRELLSHVGSDPAETMRVRLADTVRRQGDRASFVELSGGRYALREWGGAEPGPSAAAESEIRARAIRPASPVAAGEAPRSAGRQRSGVGGPRERGGRKRGARGGRKAAGRAGGGAGDVVPAMTGSAKGGESVGAKSGEVAVDERQLQLPAAALSPPAAGAQGAAPEAAEAPEGEATGRPGEGRKRRRRGKRGGKGAAQRAPEAPPEAAGPPAEPERAAAGPPPPPPPGSPAVFRDLARLPEAAVRVLRGQGGRKPLRAADILAEWSARGVPEARVPAVALAAALAGGDARRKVGAPVISVSGGRWVPAEWVAGEEIAALERKVDAAAVQHASVLRRTILRRLGEMPAAAFQQVVVALLAAMGFRDLRPFDEPAAPADRVAPAGAGDALLLRARMPYGPAEVEVVVLVVRTAPGRFVGDEQIAGLRGRMPRTGACGGVVVTTGRIGDVARRDLTPPNAIPLLAIEHDALADRLLEHRIGIVARCLEVPMVDPDVFGQAGEPDRG